MPIESSISLNPSVAPPATVATTEAEKRAAKLEVEEAEARASASADPLDDPEEPRLP